MDTTTHGGKDGKMRRTVLCGRCVVGVYSLLPLAFLVRAVVGSLCFLAVYRVWTQSTDIASDISVYLLRFPHTIYCHYERHLCVFVAYLS